MDINAFKAYVELGNKHSRLKRKIAKWADTVIWMTGAYVGTPEVNATVRELIEDMKKESNDE